MKTIVATHCLGSVGIPLLCIADITALSSTKISERLTLISGAGGNVVIFHGDDGLTLIDTGSADKTTDLVQLLNQLTNSAPVKTVFNTHWHDDHTGGNEAFHALGANILAHENTKLWLGADFTVQWREERHKPRPAAAYPDETFYLSGEKQLAGEVVQYKHFEQAHTDGDICLYFPDSNVLVTGGLLCKGRYPIADIATGGWIGGLISANTKMLEMINDTTVIIPDQGPILSRADLQAQLDMLTDLYEQMKALALQGFSGPEMLQKNVTAKYNAAWGDPTEFVLETYRGMWAHTYDMGGFI